MALIEADFSGLNRQAPLTVSGYLRTICDEVDGLLGHGYAKRNPALVAELVKAAVADFRTAALAKMIEYVGGRITETLYLLDTRSVESRASMLSALRDATRQQELSGGGPIDPSESRPPHAA